MDIVFPPWMDGRMDGRIKSNQCTLFPVRSMGAALPNLDCEFNGMGTWRMPVLAAVCWWHQTSATSWDGFKVEGTMDWTGGCGLRWYLLVLYLGLIAAHCHCSKAARAHDLCSLPTPQNLSHHHQVCSPASPNDGGQRQAFPSPEPGPQAAARSHELILVTARRSQRMRPSCSVAPWIFSGQGRRISPILAQRPGPSSP